MKKFLRPVTSESNGVKREVRYLTTWFETMDDVKTLSNEQLLYAINHSCSIQQDNFIRTRLNKTGAKRMKDDEITREFAAAFEFSTGRKSEKEATFDKAVKAFVAMGFDEEKAREVVAKQLQEQEKAEKGA